MIRNLAAALVLCTAAFAAEGEDDIRKAEAAWADAVKTGDQTKLNQMMGDGLVYTHSTGIVDTKGEYLSKLKQGTQKYATIQASNMGVHMYKDTAIVNATARMTGTTKDVPFDNKLLYTHVWVKQGGRWQLVAHQTTKIP
jgi:ketosteroid isomerase-like protein